MDFEFNGEQRMMQESVRALLSSRYDTAQAKRVADGEGFDPGLWAALAEAGVFAIAVPEAHGGLGLGPEDQVLLLEEFGRALVPAPAAETMLAADVIARFGTPAQQERWLPAIAAGELRVVPALAEAEASGLEDVALRATAARGGEGWSLTGQKVLVPNAGVAHLVLVAARFGPDGALGLAACDVSAPGLERRAHSTIDLSSRYHALTFTEVALTPDDVLGGAPRAEAAHRLFELGAAAAAAQMAGIAARVLDDSVAYAGQRVQFGRPVGAFQAIKHKCADMATAVEGARSAAYYAALALTGEERRPEKAVSVAKAFCGETARQVCNEGTQVHGGIGFTWELGLHLWLRRAKALEFAYGDTAYHRERVLARSLAELGIAA